ncbi:RNA 2',3'-cyclic phosphodiesterase [bioreactor metagenome]|uniref:RNA 2',3'-cyclic phosphodiesterase n=1 Tax=bioreactor metagenome TaxID=1076179 RepID=A0A645DRT2_9ZZZZ
MRLFVAVNFNTKTVARLLALRDELRSCCQRGNFSAPENLHLTLAFLGECNAEQAAAVKAAMDTICFKPFSVSVESVGRFKGKGGDVWWAGVRENEPLLDLQRRLTEKLIAAGFALEKRKYTPHITLGRQVITEISPWMMEPFGETVDKIELMKSERIGGKLRYTAVYEKTSQ